MKISTKISLLTLTTVLILSAASMVSNIVALKTTGGHHMKSLETLLADERKAQIKSVLSNALTLVKNANFYTVAADTLRDMRYGADNQNSFIVFDKDYLCYVYPARKKLEDTIIKEFKDADGNAIFQKILKTALKDGEGYLHYRGPGTDGRQTGKRMMYFKYFEEWHWVLCTSINVSDIDAIMAKKQTAMKEDLKAQIFGSASVSCVILVLASITGLVISRRIAAPVKETSEMFKQIADGSGDLTRRMKVNGSDETGRLSENFNSFLEKQQDMIREILYNAQTLNSSSSDLLKASAAVSTETGETSKKSAAVSQNTEKVKSTVTLVAEAMQQTLSNIKHISGVTADMNSRITHVAQETEKARAFTKTAVTHSETISETVKSLGEAANEINSITDLITEISDQTNLLALNATIEAHRAGQSGNGFGVVAREIKTLAVKSNEAAAIISDRIKLVRQTSDKTMARINEIISSIESIDPVISYISRSSEEQAAISSEILSSISQISSGMEGLNESVVNSSMALAQIEEEAALIAASSGRIDTETKAVEKNANSLFTLSDELQSGLTRFRI